MKSSSFVKLSGVILILAFVALGEVGGSILAGPQPQATAAATMAVGTASAGGAGATLAATMSFPPCPPPAGAAAATMAATTSGTMEAGMAATMAATMPATMPANPGFIGIRVEAVDNCGVRVIEVLVGSPAVTAQIQVGDVVVAVNGKAVTGLDSMRNAVGFLPAGDQVQLTIQRAGQEMTVSVTLAPRPAEIPATAPASAGGGAAATMAATMAATP
jgi:membrane-associated protease RseP (regulator of RpoE activity)